jgi:hypothetical protein
MTKQNETTQATTKQTKISQSAPPHTLSKFDKEARIKKFRQLYVPHAGVEEAIKVLRDHHQFGAGQCVLLVGDSGVGKTCLLGKYFELATKTPLPVIVEDDLEIDPLPILRVEVPSESTPKGVVEGMLAEIGDSNPSRGSLTSMLVRLFRWLKLRRVQLIILDEAQHITDRTRACPKMLYKFGDVLKSLLNRSNCPIIFSGTSEAKAIFTNEQLRRRRTAVIELQPFSFSTDKDRARFRKLVEVFEGALGFPVSSGLNTMDMAQRIHFATRGHIGHVHTLLDVALRTALEANLSCIDRELLGDIYTRLALWPDAKENPFRVTTAPLYRSPTDRVEAQIVEQAAKREALKSAA